VKSQILFVDDDESILRLLEIAMKEYDNIEVLTQTDGLSALDLLNSITPDLIILDIILPEMDGFELCQRIRNHEKYQTTPIIAFTSLPIEDVKEKLIEAGFSFFFSKTMNFFEFIQNILTLIK